MRLSPIRLLQLSNKYISERGSCLWPTLFFGHRGRYTVYNQYAGAVLQLKLKEDENGKVTDYRYYIA